MLYGTYRGIAFLQDSLTIRTVHEFHIRRNLNIVEVRTNEHNTSIGIAWVKGYVNGFSCVKGSSFE